MTTRLKVYFKKRLLILIHLLFVTSSFATTEKTLNTSQFSINKCEKVFTKEIVFTEEVLLVIQELAKLYNKIMFSQINKEELNQGKIIFKANMNELVQRLSPEEFKLAKRIIYSKDKGLIAQITQENARKFEEQRKKQQETEEAIKKVEAEQNTQRLKEILDKYRSFSDFEEKNTYFLSIRNEVEKILKNPYTNINVKNKESETILILAAIYGDKIIVDLALKQQVAVNAKSDDGYTALMRAAWNGHKEIVQMLIKAKADVNAKQNDGETTALMNAAWYGHTEIVQMLIDAKADVDAKRYDGVTALILAARKHHIEIVQMLIDAKADVNAKDIKGWSALMWAAHYTRTAIVQMLKAAGAKE